MVTATNQYGQPVTPTQPGFMGMPAGVSSIPSIGGLFNGQQAGNGQPLPSSIPSYSAGNIGVPAQYAALMASTNPEHKAMQDQIRSQYQGTGQGPLSTFPGGTVAPQGGAAGQQQQQYGDAQGQSEYEKYLASRNAAVNATANRQYGDTGSGNSISGGGSASAGQSAGGALGLNPNAVPQGSTPRQLNAGLSVPSSGQQINYAPPSNTQFPQQGGGALQMQNSNPQDALASYYNTAGYQNLNAPGAFQQSPGYQFAMDQAINQSQGNAAARGLLESGSALRGMNQAVQGVAQQDYGNWWNRQNNQFNDYQNRLAGLAGGNVGGDQAFQAGMGQAQGTMQTGQNIGSLFGNQGTAGYGGMVNVGGAQAGNMNTAGAQQAQINSANQSTQLAGAVYNRGLF